MLTYLLLALLICHAGVYAISCLNPPVAVIQYDQRGFSLVVTKHAEPILVQLTSSSRLNPVFSVLRFKASTGSRIERRYSVMIFPDSADPQLLRQLRVLLYSGLYQDADHV